MRSWFVVLCFALSLALPAAASAGKDAAADSAVAPRFTLPLRTGTVSLDSLQAKIIYVDFWASWCEPCHRSFPWLAELHKQYADKGLVIVAINLDKVRDPAYAFLEKHPAPFRVAFDPEGKTAEAYHVSTMPSSFLIGPSGKILLAHTGFVPGKTADVENLIKEACSQ